MPDELKANTSAGGGDPKHQASAGDAGAGAKSLEDLLAEWGQPEAGGDGDKAKGSDAKDSPPIAKELLDRLNALERADAERIYKAEMSDVVQRVKGDLQVDDLIVEAWVNHRADGDKRLVDLWKGRDAHRGKFDAALKALRSEFSEYAKEQGVGKAQTSASRRLAGAVAGAREAGDPGGHGLDNVNWAGLSDSEFALKKAEVFRRAESGRL